MNGNELDYFQLFGDMIIKGNWLHGDDDELRRPHATYSARWNVNVHNLSTVVQPYDILLWNMGHHRCEQAKKLDSVHIALHSLAERVVFITTTGLNPCKTTPSKADIFNTGMFNFNKQTNYWDNGVHLNGLENLKLATGLWNHIMSSMNRPPQR